MRDLVSPLDGFSSPFGQRRNPFDAYRANGLRPAYVADFGDGFFGANSAVSTLSGVAEFGRIGSATYLDHTGTLQTAATGAARYPAYTYVSGVLTWPYLQLESEARTNLETNSNDFVTLWTKQNLTNTAAQATGPDGLASLSSWVPSTGNTTHNLIRSYTTTGSTNYTLSQVYKAGGYNFVIWRIDDGAGNGVKCSFNVSTGAVSTALATNGTGLAAIKSGVIDMGNGLYRCYATFTTKVGGTTTRFIPYVSNADYDAFSVTAFVGDGTSGVYAGFTDFVASSAPSSYIPTNGSTVTRPAETLTAPYEALPWGAAVSHALKGKITYADLASATQVLLYDRRVDANNRITLALDTAGANTGKFALTMVVGGVSATISTTAELTPGVDQDFNVAFACTATDVGIALNGTAETRVSHALGLPALSTTDATLAGMVFQDTALGWAVDIGNTGLAEATA